MPMGVLAVGSSFILFTLLLPSMISPPLSVEIPVPGYEVRLCPALIVTGLLPPGTSNAVYAPPKKYIFVFGR